uniref:Uncharacterized protein n=1 Tax=mine drainage metagenome TaxID=410659 RepID=E6QBA9_9ZZZZ
MPNPSNPDENDFIDAGDEDIDTDYPLPLAEREELARQTWGTASRFERTEGFNLLLDDPETIQAAADGDDYAVAPEWYEGLEMDDDEEVEAVATPRNPLVDPDPHDRLIPDPRASVTTHASAQNFHRWLRKAVPVYREQIEGAQLSADVGYAVHWYLNKSIATITLAVGTYLRKKLIIADHADARDAASRILRQVIESHDFKRIPNLNIDKMCSGYFQTISQFRTFIAEGIGVSHQDIYYMAHAKPISPGHEEQNGDDVVDIDLLHPDHAHPDALNAGLCRYTDSPMEVLIQKQENARVMRLMRQNAGAPVPNGEDSMGSEDRMPVSLREVLLRVSQDPRGELAMATEIARFLARRSNGMRNIRRGLARHARTEAPTAVLATHILDLMSGDDRSTTNTKVGGA